MSADSLSLNASVFSAFTIVNDPPVLGPTDAQLTTLATPHPA
jgi:hypothetical protein